MSDETERPEDTVRRFALEIHDLEAWKRKYTEAAELWDALELKGNQQVKDAVLIGKIVDFERNIVSITMSVTDGVDWMDQIGIIETAKIMCAQAPLESDDD